MSRNQGGIPRWLTGINLAAILVALAVVVPAQVRASHTPSPTNLCVCFRLSPTAPKLTWTDTASSSTIQGYILQRSKTADFTSNIIEIRISRNTFDFIDETTEFDRTFHYRVASFAGTDRSGWSNGVTAVNGSGTAGSKPATPTNLSVTPEGNALRITWANPATNETGVWVQRSSDNGTTWEYRASLSLNSTNFLDTDPPTGGPMYRVATFNSAGASYSYAVQYVNSSAPGVPTVGPIAPSIPQFSVPGVPTVGPIPTVNPSIPGASVPPGVIPSDPGAIASPWLNLIPSNPATVASPFLSAIPSNPATLVPSMNPTTLIPTVRDPNTYRLWVGVRFGPAPNQSYSGAWMLPAACAFSQSCQPPKGELGLVCFGIPNSIEFCYLIDATLN